MKNNALKIKEKDNVAVATQHLKKDVPVIIDGKNLFNATEDIDIGHKVALSPIPVHGNIFRYGEPILEATRDISEGEWVHVHNTRPIQGKETTQGEF